MNANIEKLEGSNIKITFDVAPEKFEEGLQYAYKQNQGKFSLPGFRKGKVPRAMVEKMYGPEVLYDDAINHIFPDIYESVINENDLDVVSKPEASIVEADKVKGLTLSVEVTLKPVATVSNYKGLTYTEKAAEVTEEDITKAIDAELKKNSRTVTITDRPAESGDLLSIDFDGYINGEPFEGGKGEDHKLELGSNTFIPGFEDQLIGHNTGDHVEVNVTFPEEYHSEDCAGKPALFKVFIREIQKNELPELNDDFAADVSEFETLEEYKNDIKQKLLEEKSKKVQHEIEEELIEKAMENLEVEVPDAMVETQITQMIDQFSRSLYYQGLDINAFLQFSGQSMDDLRETYSNTALKNVKARLLLEAIADAEGFTVTDEEFDAEVTRIADESGFVKERLEALIKPADAKGIKNDLKTQRAVKFLVEHGVPVPEEKTETEENKE